MAPRKRLSLAKEAYQAALAAVRLRSTAQTWARLLRTAQNLREAEREAGARNRTYRPPG